MLDPARIFRYRGLLFVLTSRELKGRYRGSVLGFLWSLVTPLLLLVVYTFVFSIIFRPRFEGADPYPVFLVAGLFPWIWISTSVLEGTVSLTASASLIRKTVFPAELLPLVPVFSNLMNFVFALPVIGIGLVAARALGHSVGGWGLMVLPLVVVVQLPFVAGLSLGFSALTVHFKDVRDIVTNLITLFFFASPIIYSLDSIEYEWLRNLIRLNPFSPFILAFQHVLFAGVVPPPWIWGQMALMSAVSWLAGSWIFDRLSESLAEAV